MIGGNSLEIELPEGHARKAVMERLMELAENLGLEATPHARGEGRSRRDRQRKEATPPA